MSASLSCAAFSGPYGQCGRSHPSGQASHLPTSVLPVEPVASSLQSSQNSSPVVPGGSVRSALVVVKNTKSSIPLHPPEPTVTLITDASLSGLRMSLSVTRHCVQVSNDLPCCTQVTRSIHSSGRWWSNLSRSLLVTCTRTCF